MKKIFYTLAMLLMSISMQAQTNDIKAQSIYDVNQDDKVAVSDVTAVVNRLKVADGSSTEKTVVDTDKLLEILNSLYDKIAAQNAKIDALSNSLAQIKTKLGIEDPDPNLLPGKFSVSATKQVQFTKSNLYWNGSAFKFEENQTDYPTTWSTTHVGHFFWTSLTDYQSGNASYMPYAENYSYSSQSASDKFWCGEDNPLTVEGTSDLYALTGGSDGEWNYLINNRTNAINLYKYGVTVGSVANCLIIASDDFDGTLQSSYTLDEVNSLGFVCLPVAGSRDGGSFGGDGRYGGYRSATPGSRGSDDACGLSFYSNSIYTDTDDYRSYGRSLRLVRTVE